MAERKRIKIHMSPFKPEDGRFAVEKDVGGRRRRYLCGVASGPKEDSHGERVTPNCIQSLARQAEAGDVLLFPDVHGISESQDIGILTHFEVTDSGEWYVEFRIYDQDDPVDSAAKERADKLWRQVNGLPPYRKPRKKGFSIEGYIPDDRVLMDAKERLGRIDDMVLEGVVIVPQPAYQDSVIHAVYKALGETPPWQVRKGIRSRLESAMVRKDRRGAFDRERWQVEAARDDMVAEAVRSGADEERLRAIFDEYRDLMVELIRNNESSLLEEGVPESEPGEASPYPVGPTRDEIFRRLRAELKRWDDLRGNGRIS